MKMPWGQGSLCPNFSCPSKVKTLLCVTIIVLLSSSHPFSSNHKWKCLGARGTSAQIVFVPKRLTLCYVLNIKCHFSAITNFVQTTNENALGLGEPRPKFFLCLKGRGSLLWVNRKVVLLSSHQFCSNLELKCLRAKGNNAQFFQTRSSLLCI